jgi:hypothetical protein
LLLSVERLAAGAYVERYEFLTSPQASALLRNERIVVTGDRTFQRA